MQLQCSNRGCGQPLARDFAAFECPACGDLLELSLNGFRADPSQLRDLWQQRRASNSPADRSGVWRFCEFLPAYGAEQIVTLGEGNTSLISGSRASDFARLNHLQFKHLGWN